MRKYGGFATTWGAHTGIGTLPIVYFGTEEQKKKYLPGAGQRRDGRRLRAFRIILGLRCSELPNPSRRFPLMASITF